MLGKKYNSCITLDNFMTEVGGGLRQTDAGSRKAFFDVYESELGMSTNMPW